jgi:hypothetical protein
MKLLRSLPFTGVKCGMLLCPGVGMPTKAVLMVAKFDSTSPPDCDALIQFIEWLLTLFAHVTQVDLSHCAHYVLPIFCLLAHVYVILHVRCMGVMGKWGRGMEYICNKCKMIEIM